MAGVQQLLDCMISSWYPTFQRATFKTVILPLPQPILDWLVSDGLHLPDDSQAFAKRGPLDEYALEDEYKEWSESDEEAGSDAGSEDTGSAAPQPPPAELAELRRQLAEAIAELGGRVVPKLSWSCPKDAVWMSPSSSLCCTHPDEVLLLLRSSDRVAHDICAALPEAAAAAALAPAASATSGSTAAAAAPPEVQHCLALRRWHDLQPGREFRCFVRGHALVGGCQRDLTQCFEFLREERAELAAAIAAFHARHIQGRFPHPHFTYDVYVAASGAVKLMDFNPVGGTTAPLLFSWEELGLGLAASPQADAGGAGAAADGIVGDACEAAAARGAAEAAAEPAAACSSCCGAHQAAAPGAEAAAAAGEQAGQGAGETAERSYLEQLRRVQALSLAEQQPQQPQQQHDTLAAGDRQPSLAGAAAHSPQPLPFELRIIEEPVAMRPATLAYGVPFDFVDSSEGSALDRLMQQAQQAGAGELWAALAAQSGGGGGGAAGSG
ncbi:hypothetical protein ABPG75_009362 [Micractinium tetrahymenae]